MTTGLTLDLLVEGRIATLAGETGFGWVEAIGVAGGRVVAAGPRRDVDALVGTSTRRLALAPDEVVLPALRDAHIHLVEAARTVNQVDLSDAATLVDGLEIVAAAHRQLPEAWLEGTGWDVARWGGWPTAADLDRVVPCRPAFLWSHELHQVWVNSAALTAAGIDAMTSDPPDGRIRRDETGRPTGMLHEGASKLVTRHAPEPTREWLATAIEAYCRGLLAYGIVAVHDLAQLVPDVDLTGGIAIVRDLADGGRLPVRVHASIRTEALRAGDRGRIPEWRAARRIRPCPIRMAEDLRRRIALLPHCVPPRAVGAPMTSAERRRPGHAAFRRRPPTRWRSSRAEPRPQASRRRSTRSATRPFGAALDALAPVAGMTTVPSRIEHLQFVDPSDVGRFHALGVVASVQPIHLRGDAHWARAGLGDRAERIGYPWRTVARRGGLLAFGADAPYEDVDPWPGLAIAVTRADPSWPTAEAFGAHEALTLEMAVRAHCLHPALAAGERDRGRLAPGHRADLMVVPAAAIDEPTIPGGPLATARPRLVLEAGEVAFER